MHQSKIHPISVLFYPTDIWLTKNRTRWEGCDNGKGAVPRKLGGQKEMILKDGRERERERERESERECSHRVIWVEKENDNSFFEIKRHVWLM